MTEENWKNFTKDIHKSLTDTTPSRQITDSVSLNKSWHNWFSIVKHSANKNIPTTYTAPKPFHALSLKASKLHQVLNHINKCIHILVSTHTPFSIEYITKLANKHLAKTNRITETPQALLLPLDLSSAIVDNTQTSYYNNTIKRIKELKTTIWKSRNIERNLEQTE